MNLVLCTTPTNYRKKSSVVTESSWNFVIYTILTSDLRSEKDRVVKEGGCKG